MKHYLRWVVFLSCLVAVPALGQTPPASTSLTLEAAMAEAYKTSPDLEAARAELRSVDEEYTQAKSGYRPVLTGEAGYTSSRQDGNLGATHGDPKSIELALTQPLYRGGSTTANVKTADNRIQAQRALLTSVEQSVFLNVVTSYMDVLRDQEIVQLSKNNENVLSKHLTASQKRFELGDITKTDVSQSVSRLAAATAGRVRAEGNYQASRAIFERAVGLEPDALKKPDMTKIMIPSTLEGAIADAEKNNPDIIFAHFSKEAAESTTRSIRGELLPQVSLSGAVGETYDPTNRADNSVTATSIGVTATMPLYSGGGTESRVRQSRQVEQQRRMEINRAGRDVRQRVINAWTNLTAANAEIKARQSQINATQLALEGVTVEAEYGSRTTLDLLDAEQEYLDAQVAYVTAERNQIVAIYTLLTAIGELTADKLTLNVDLYDPKIHFRKVKNKWTGLKTPE